MSHVQSKGISRQLVKKSGCENLGYGNVFFTCVDDMIKMKCQSRAGVIFLPGQEGERRAWANTVSLKLTLS